MSTPSSKNFVPNFLLRLPLPSAKGSSLFPVHTPVLLLGACLLLPGLCHGVEPAPTTSTAQNANRSSSSTVESLVDAASWGNLSLPKTILPILLQMNSRAMLQRAGGQGELGSDWNPSDPRWQKAEPVVLQRLQAMARPDPQDMSSYDRHLRQAVVLATPREQQEALAYYASAPGRQARENGPVAEAFALLQSTQFAGGKLPEHDPDALRLQELFRQALTATAEADQQQAPPPLVIRLRKIAGMALADQLNTPANRVRRHFGRLYGEIESIIKPQ